MKIKKILAVILCAVVLVCTTGCGAAETENVSGDLGNDLTRAANIENETTTKAETTAAVNEVTTEKKAKITIIVDPDEKAKLVFQNAATYATKVQIEGNKFTSTVMKGNLDDYVTELPQMPREISENDLQTAIQYYLGTTIGGYYVIKFDSRGNPTAAYWAQTMESSYIGAYPNNEYLDITLQEIYDETATVKEFDSEKRAKLTYQNAATYATKVQIQGVHFTSNVMTGDLTEQTSQLPGPKATGVDEETLQSVMQYYMGVENGGYYVIQFDGRDNPIFAYWSTSMDSTEVGAYPYSEFSGKTLQEIYDELS
ncbi:MAG: hypothetical protein LBL87_02825 [Ruminococcus sp.]|nr:hypothetical protein [Ruminococcus sp.]